MPVNNNNSSEIGTSTALNQGAPTVILMPRTASETTGNNVPQNTAKQAPRNTTLFNKKADSRDTTESMRTSLLSKCKRKPSTVNENVAIKPTKPKNNGPRLDCVKLCTDEMTPLRVRNVPKMQRVKVRMINTMFHTRSIFFFS